MSAPRMEQSAGADGRQLSELDTERDHQDRGKHDQRLAPSTRHLDRHGVS